MINGLTITKQTMSSVEIAELTGKRHDNVMRTARTLAMKGIILAPQLEERYGINNTSVRNYYQLSKTESLNLVAKLSPEFTAKIIERWQELEKNQYNRVDVLNDPAYLRQALLGYTEKVIALEDKVEQDKPMAVRNMQGACQVGDFAKTIGLGRNRLFKLMRDDGILMRDNLPYQRYCDNDCFVVNEQIPYTDSKGKTHPAFTTMVTGKGQVFLEKKYRPSI